MWVALFLVCLPNIGCEEVVETQRTYHATKEQCEENAIAKSLYMTEKFRELGHDTKIWYRCDKDRSIRES